MANGLTEEARLSALKGYGVLDTPNEPEFDLIVREAARVLGTPIALISLVDERRQWFKAKVGIDAAETPRLISFCTHAIRGDGVLVVEDTTIDKRFADNPLVTGDPFIRFYVGTPLKTVSGQRIGTLCVIDTRPRRRPTMDEEGRFAHLASRTITAMENRRMRRANDGARSAS